MSFPWKSLRPAMGVAPQGGQAWPLGAGAGAERDLWTTMETARAAAALLGDWELPLGGGQWNSLGGVGAGDGVGRPAQGGLDSGELVLARRGQFGVPRPVGEALRGAVPRLPLEQKVDAAGGARVEAGSARRARSPRRQKGDGVGMQSERRWARLGVTSEAEASQRCPRPSHWANGTEIPSEWWETGREESWMPCFRRDVLDKLYAFEQGGEQKPGAALLLAQPSGLEGQRAVRFPPVALGPGSAAQLAAQSRAVMGEHIKPGTKVTYDSHGQRYFTHALLYEYPALFPATVDDDRFAEQLCGFLTTMSSYGYAVATIRSAANAVKKLAATYGLRGEKKVFITNTRVKTLLKGMEQAWGEPTKKKFCLTAEMVVGILEVQMHAVERKEILARAVVSLTYHCTLRASEAGTLDVCDIVWDIHRFQARFPGAREGEAWLSVRLRKVMKKREPWEILLTPHPRGAAAWHLDCLCLMRRWMTLARLGLSNECQRVEDGKVAEDCLACGPLFRALSAQGELPPQMTKEQRAQAIKRLVQRGVGVADDDGAPRAALKHLTSRPRPGAIGKEFVTNEVKTRMAAVYPEFDVASVSAISLRAGASADSRLQVLERQDDGAAAGAMVMANRRGGWTDDSATAPTYSAGDLRLRRGQVRHLGAGRGDARA